VVKLDASNFQSGRALDGGTASPKDAGSDDTLDSDGDATTHQTGPFTLAARQVDLDQDFGFTFLVCNLTAGALTTSKNPIEWPITNTGTTKETISEIDITWPTANGKLTKVLVDGGTIWDTKASPPSTVITVFKGSVDARSWTGGKTRKLRFQFEKSPVKDTSQYHITVKFTDGCSLHFN